MSETCKKQTADLDRRGGQQLKTERRYLALERVECRLSLGDLSGKMA